jgi:hypothetical protein
LNIGGTVTQGDNASLIIKYNNTLEHSGIKAQGEIDTPGSSLSLEFTDNPFAIGLNNQMTILTSAAARTGTFKESGWAVPDPNALFAWFPEYKPREVVVKLLNVPVAQALPINPEVNVAFLGPVALFDPGTVNPVASDYTATIH